MRRSHDARKTVIREFCLLFLGVDMDTVDDDTDSHRDNTTDNDHHHHQQQQHHQQYHVCPPVIKEMLKRQRQYVVDAFDYLKNAYTQHHHG